MRRTREEWAEIENEMISKVDKEIYSSIIRFVLNSQGDTRSDQYNEDWLREWARAKAPMYLRFGRSLRNTREIDTQVELSEGREIAERFCEEEFQDDKFLLVREVFKIMAGTKGGYEMHYRRHNGDGGENSNFAHISIDSIARNTLPRSTTLFKKEYKKGAKISSLLRDLVRVEDREEFDIIYSRFIQSLSAKGLLSVSIDPIDFLTMSENKSNWSSCHRLEGEYRAGTVSYMLDPYTAISYVQNSSLVGYRMTDGLEWNSKKWRQVVFIDVENNTLAQSRQYPADNSCFDEGVYNILAEGVFAGIEMKRLSTENREVSFRESGWIIDINFFEGDELHYNDLIHYNCNRSFALPKDKEMRDIPYVEIGANVECVCGCGDYVTSADRLHSSNHYDDDCYDDEEDDYQ